MKRMLIVLSLLAIVTAACAGAASEAAPAAGERADLPPAGPEEITAIIVADGRPALVNVWASWCGPCRSEAPLLKAAFEEYGDRVQFIGVDVQDTQEGAKRFLEEFDLQFDQYFDQGRSVPIAWGGFGVPITFFVAGNGDILATHNGIIDERTLLEGIEGLLASA